MMKQRPSSSFILHPFSVSLYLWGVIRLTRMTDTQWPRFEVFLVESDGKPAEHVGSVHAPDPEMALLNARDVFVRRPFCRELWVVPSDRVLFRSGEELKKDEPAADAGSLQASDGRYLVFAKPNHRDPLALSQMPVRIVSGSRPAPGSQGYVRSDCPSGQLFVRPT